MSPSHHADTAKSDTFDTWPVYTTTLPVVHALAGRARRIIPKAPVYQERYVAQYTTLYYTLPCTLLHHPVLHPAVHHRDHGNFKARQPENEGTFKARQPENQG